MKVGVPANSSKVGVNVAVGKGVQTPVGVEVGVLVDVQTGSK